MSNMIGLRTRTRTVFENLGSVDDRSCITDLWIHYKHYVIDFALNMMYLRKTSCFKSVVKAREIWQVVLIQKSEHKTIMSNW